MLIQARKATAGSSGISLVQANCAITRMLRPESLDLIMLHWVLNTTNAWYEIVGNCTAALRPGGVLLWFDERGSLYQAIDGEPNGFWRQGCDFSRALWDHFYKGLGPWGQGESLRIREGLPMGAETSLNAIVNKGFKVTKLAAEKRSWSRFITIEWLVRRVLEPRAFSNLWRIPEPIYEGALKGLSDWMETYPHAARQSIRLDYNATPVLAIKA
jgi:hypothetical protein